MVHCRLLIPMLFCALAVRAETAPTAPQITLRMDITDATELKDWSESARAEIEKFYPTLATKLGLSGAREMAVALKKNIPGSGSVSGTNVVLSADYFKARPDEIGTAVFLVTRALQKYSAKNAPSWMVTGIADYIRWHLFEPAEKRGVINGKTAKYTHGFSDAAAFLAWIERTHDKDILRKLHTALANGAHSDDLLKEFVGKSAQELWPEFLAALSKEAEVLAAKNIDATIAKPQPLKTSVTFTGVGEAAFADAPEGHTLRYTLDGSFPSKESLAYCAPVRVASSLKIRAALFNAAGKCSEPVEVTCVCEGEGEKPGAAINVDFSAAPDLKEWAIKAQKDCSDFYFSMTEMLKSDGFKPSRQIAFYFVEERKGLGNGIPAYALSNESAIYFHAEHIRKNPLDFGMAIHELCHIVQKYCYSRNSPSWLVEGIADWVRWENWEPAAKRRHVDPLRAKYTNGYSDTARFLTWLQATHDKEIVRKLNAALRVGKYDDGLFKASTGKDVGELWKDFVATLTKN